MLLSTPLKDGEYRRTVRDSERNRTVTILSKSKDGIFNLPSPRKDCVLIVFCVFSYPYGRKSMEFKMSISQTKVCGYKTKILAYPHEGERVKVGQTI